MPFEWKSKPELIALGAKPIKLSPERIMVEYHLPCPPSSSFYWLDNQIWSKPSGEFCTDYMRLGSWKSAR